jgi:hypothetical protein
MTIQETEIVKGFLNGADMFGILEVATAADSLITGGSDWLTKNAKCCSIWMHCDIYDLFFVLWLLESELYYPMGEISFNSKVLSRAVDRLVNRLSVLQTFSK